MRISGTGSINVNRILTSGILTFIKCVFYNKLLTSIPEAYGWTSCYYSRNDNCGTIENRYSHTKGRCRRLMTSTEHDNFLEEPAETESNFGRMGYWDDFYSNNDEFSWYSPWSDIGPFFTELVPLPQDNSQTPRVLLPGIGNDGSMVDMYDAGYKKMTAFDYAPEGVECAKRFFGEERLIQADSNLNSSSQQSEEGVDLQVADARDLPFENNSFDAVLEKGTLDAVYLSGAKDKEASRKHLSMAVSELARVTTKGGIVMSITAACADAVKKAFTSDKWQTIRDGDFYMTEDGYSSNNVDAIIYAWKRL